MTELRSAGFFRELDHGDAEGPSLHDARSAGPLAHEADIIVYLAYSPVVTWSPTLTRDVLGGGAPIDTLAIHSDGVWAWPSDLVHYVGTYHVALDPDFLAHMEARSWRPPSEDEVEVDTSGLGLPTPD